MMTTVTQKHIERKKIQKMGDNVPNVHEAVNIGYQSHSQHNSYRPTPCSKKVSGLMFDDNFGKCGPIFTIFHQIIRKKILYAHIIKISTLPAICC